MLWECLECSARYAWDLRACPNCGSTRREEDGMPKITVAHGATHPQTQQEGAEQCPPETTSETSTPKPLSTPETNETVLRQRARKTASPSRKARKASSSVPGATTDGPETADADD